MNPQSSFSPTPSTALLIFGAVFCLLNYFLNKTASSLEDRGAQCLSTLPSLKLALAIHFCAFQDSWAHPQPIIDSSQRK